MIENRRFTRALTQALIAMLIAVVVGCASAPVRYTLSHEEVSRNDITLATIDGRIPIRASDVMKRLDNSGIAIRGGTLPWDSLRDTLVEIVNDSLVAFIADTFDLKQDVAGWTDYSLIRENLLKRELINRLVYPQITLDSQQVDSFYFARGDIFTYESQINLAHIVLSKAGYRMGEDSAIYQQMSDSELDSLIWYRLNLLKAEIHDSLDFAEAARLYSLDERTGEHGGRFGWITKQDLHPEIERVLYDSTTPLHTVIGPVESRDGVHLFYMYDRHFRGIPPLTSERYVQAEQALKNVLAQGILLKLVDSMRTAHPAVFNDSALLADRKTADFNAWVAWAEGIDTVRFKEFDNAAVPYRSRFNTLIFTREQARFIAQTLVDEKLIILLSEETGIPESPGVKEELERNYRKFARIAVRRMGEAPGYTPTNEEVATYFTEHEADFIPDRPLKIQQILVEDSLLAEFIAAQAESGEDFLELAEQYYTGEPEIRRAAADLGWIGPNDFDSALYAAATKAEPGSVIGPIKTRYGYHVVKILEYKRAPTLAEATPKIRAILIEQHRAQVKEDWEKMIHRNHRVSYNPVVIDSVVLPPVEDRRERPGAGHIRQL